MNLKDEALKYVTVGQKEIKIRKIFLEEHGQSVEITQWRGLANSPVYEKDFNEISHRVVSQVEEIIEHNEKIHL